MSAYIDNIEYLSQNNKYYRRVLFTTQEMQLVLMSLKPLEEIGEEIHPKTTQFIRVEKGMGLAIIDNVEYEISDGDVVVIPGGTLHNIINSSDTHPLKLYTIYSPPEHDDYKIDVFHD